MDNLAMYSSQEDQAVVTANIATAEPSSAKADAPLPVVVPVKCYLL